MDAPAWLDELHLEPGPPAHAMGTRSLPLDQWLQPRPGDGDLIERKRSLLRTHRGDVVAVSPAATPYVDDVAAALDAGELVDAVLTTAEDVCVLVHHDGHWRLEAGVVCFPSMWRLPDKIGLPMALVHGPVPHYADELADRVDRFLERLQPDRPVWRRNWFVHDTPELFLPRPPAPRLDVHVPGDLWLRSERQTLRRLGDLPVILFTIRTDIVPLSVIRARGDICRQMARAVASWSPDLVAYRGASSWRDDLVRWLETTG